MNKTLLKSKLCNNELTIGSWLTLGHPGEAEIMARAGFEWLTIDMEHSTITLREAENLIRVIELVGAAPLVRLSSNDAVQIKRVMDAGAHGVIVPTVNTPEEAKLAVGAVYYPPRGSRGVGLARAQGYGAAFDEYKEWLREEAVVVVQIEHIQAVENLESILAVEGVDAFIVGPYDLSGSLGIPGDFEHPKMIEAQKRICEVAAQLNVAAGYHVVQPDTKLVEEKIREGFTFIAYSVDFLFLGEVCRQGIKEIRSFLKKSKLSK